MKINFLKRVAIREGIFINMDFKPTLYFHQKPGFFSKPCSRWLCIFERSMNGTMRARFDEKTVVGFKTRV